SFLLAFPLLQDLPPFPTRRSSDLSKDFTQRMYELEAQRYAPNSVELDVEDWADRSLLKKYVENVARLTSSLLLAPRGSVDRCSRDRKSTRLNSSHVSISYAVFCLK